MKRPNPYHPASPGNPIWEHLAATGVAPNVSDADLKAIVEDVMRELGFDLYRPDRRWRTAWPSVA